MCNFLISGKMHFLIIYKSTLAQQEHWHESQMYDYDWIGWCFLKKASYKMRLPRTRVSNSSKHQKLLQCHDNIADPGPWKSHLFEGCCVLLKCNLFRPEQYIYILYVLYCIVLYIVLYMLFASEKKLKLW